MVALGNCYGHHQENQGHVSAVSIELLPLQVTWGSQYLISSLGRKGSALPGGHSSVFIDKPGSIMEVRRPAEGTAAFGSSFVHLPCSIEADNMHNG